MQNLSILKNTFVDKIEIKEGRAIGVQATHRGKSIFIGANKEVICSAGAIGSPHLLQLSGIGDAELLRQYDIEVVADRKGVGQNLQDHLVASLLGRQKICLASTSWQPSACQIPFDAELIQALS